MAGRHQVCSLQPLPLSSQHFALLLKYLIHVAIPDIPGWVAEEMAKLEYQRREAFKVLGMGLGSVYLLCSWGHLLAWLVAMALVGREVCRAWCNSAPNGLGPFWNPGGIQHRAGTLNIQSPPACPATSHSGSGTQPMLPRSPASATVLRKLRSGSMSSWSPTLGALQDQSTELSMVVKFPVSMLPM